MALTVKQCRELLDEESYSDEQISQIRDTISAIVSQTIEQLIRNGGGVKYEDCQAK